MKAEALKPDHFGGRRCAGHSGRGEIGLLEEAG